MKRAYFAQIFAAFSFPDGAVCLVSIAQKAFLPSDDRDVSRLGLQQEEGMSGKAAKITLTEKQQAILEQIVRSRPRHGGSCSGRV